jgi:hypothetical protein
MSSITGPAVVGDTEVLTGHGGAYRDFDKLTRGTTAVTKTHCTFLSMRVLDFLQLPVQVACTAFTYVFLYFCRTYVVYKHRRDLDALNLSQHAGAGLPTAACAGIDCTNNIYCGCLCILILMRYLCSIYIPP